MTNPRVVNSRAHISDAPVFQIIHHVSLKIQASKLFFSSRIAWPAVRRAYSRLSWKLLAKSRAPALSNVLRTRRQNSWGEIAEGEALYLEI